MDGHADDESAPNFIEETEWRHDHAAMPPAIASGASEKGISSAMPSSAQNQRRQKDSDSSEMKSKGRRSRASSLDSRSISGTFKDTVSNRLSRSKSPEIRLKSESRSPSSSPSKASATSSTKQRAMHTTPSTSPDSYRQTLSGLSGAEAMLGQHNQHKSAGYKVIGGHSVKRSSHKSKFGNRFFSRIKMHKMSDTPSPDADAVLQQHPNSPETMAHTIRELTIEVGDLRKRQLESSYFEASVDRNSSIFRAVYICHHCIRRKQILAKVRALYRWVQFTASRRSAEITQTLYTRRAEENAKHNLVIKSIMAEFQRIGVNVDGGQNGQTVHDKSQVLESNVMLITRRNGKTRKVNVLHRNRTLELSMRYMQKEILALQLRNAKLEQQLIGKRGFSKISRNQKSKRYGRGTSLGDTQSEKFLQLVEESADISITALRHSNRKSLHTRTRNMKREREKFRLKHKKSSNLSRHLFIGSTDQKHAEHDPKALMVEEEASESTLATASAKHSIQTNRTARVTESDILGKPYGHENGHAPRSQTHNAPSLHTAINQRRRVTEAMREARLEKTVHDYEGALRKVFKQNTAASSLGRSTTNPHGRHMFYSEWIFMCRKFGIIGGHLSQRFVSDVFDEFSRKENVSRTRDSSGNFLNYDAFILALEKCAWQHTLNRYGQQNIDIRAGLHLGVLMSIMEGHGCKFRGIKGYVRKLEEEAFDFADSDFQNNSRDLPEDLEHIQDVVFAEAQGSTEGDTTMWSEESGYPLLKSQLRKVILDGSHAGNGLRDFLLHDTSVPYTEFKNLLVQAAGVLADPSQMAEIMMECDPLGEGIVSPGAVSNVLQEMKVETSGVADNTTW